MSARFRAGEALQSAARIPLCGAEHGAGDSATEVAAQLDSRWKIGWCDNAHFGVGHVEELHQELSICSQGQLRV